MKDNAKNQDMIHALNALKRMDTKIENLKLEFKATGHPRKYDMDEMLSLISMVRKDVERLARW